MVSILSVCGMAVVCAAAVLPSAVVWLVPYSSHCSAGEYCCHVVHCSLPGVWRVGGECLCVLFVWWVSSVHSPLVVVEGGAIVDGGVHVGGEWHSEEGRLCCWPPRLVRGVPRLCVGVPLVVYPVALLNGGVWWCVLSPCSDWVWHPRIVLPSSCCLVPSRVVLFPLSVVCCEWGSAVACAVLPPCCYCRCAVQHCRVVVVCVVSCERLYSFSSPFPPLVFAVTALLV